MTPCEKCGEVHLTRFDTVACTAHSSRTGNACTNAPINGTTVCGSHGGRAKQVKAKAAEVVEARDIRLACDRLGLSRDVDPGEALLELVREAAGNLEFYRQLVAELPVHPDDDELVQGEGEPYWKRGDPGIYGRSYHVSGLPTGEAKRHILVQMYDDERDRLGKYCDLALKAGVQERAIRLAEAQAKGLFEGVAHAMKAAKLTIEQAEVFRVELANHIRQSGSAQLAR